MAVFITGTEMGASGFYSLGEGVVLGTLFERRETAEEQFELVLDDQQRSTIINSRGHRLIERYWGRYVAFLHERRTDENLILRDPTGGLPCLWFDSTGVQICCSWLEDGLQLEPQRFSINWDTLTTRLAVALFHSEHSTLNEVSELRAGECVRFHGNSQSRAFYWSPVDVIDRERIENPDLATAAIRRTTDLCVQAWASRYRSIIHYLSGGLDSAIVLASLRSAKIRTHVTGLNYYAEGADGDERHYARAAAQSAGCELIERRRSVNVDLRGMLIARRTANPSSSYVRLEASQHEADLAASIGAEGIFSGDGGDALFFRSPAASSAIDYVRYHGIAARSLAIAFNAAYLDDVSVWLILRDMWRYGVRRNRLHTLIERRSDWGAISTPAVELIRQRGDFIHPWFEHADAVPPGKLGQAFLLSFAPDFYDPLGQTDQPEHACPLLSQPLVELCLQIPTYVLAPGPQDRMLARNAFAAVLPDEIRSRATKGSLARHVKRVLDGNLGFLADFLLDGVLVRQGLLDRKKLLAALSDSPSREKYWAPELFEYASIEGWARHWTAAQ